MISEKQTNAPRRRRAICGMEMQTLQDKTKRRHQEGGEGTPSPAPGAYPAPAPKYPRGKIKGPERHGKKEARGPRTQNTDAKRGRVPQKARCPPMPHSGAKQAEAKAGFSFHGFSARRPCRARGVLIACAVRFPSGSCQAPARCGDVRAG